MRPTHNNCTQTLVTGRSSRYLKAGAPAHLMAHAMRTWCYAHMDTRKRKLTAHFMIHRISGCLKTLTVVIPELDELVLVYCSPTIFICTPCPIPHLAVPKRTRALASARARIHSVHTHLSGAQPSPHCISNSLEKTAGKVGGLRRTLETYRQKHGLGFVGV